MTLPLLNWRTGDKYAVALNHNGKQTLVRKYRTMKGAIGYIDRMYNHPFYTNKIGGWLELITSTTEYGDFAYVHRQIEASVLTGRPAVFKSTRKSKSKRKPRRR